MTPETLNRYNSKIGVSQSVMQINHVLDLVSQIRDVVLVRRTFSSGKPQGVGILVWGGDGEGMGRSVSGNLGPRWTGSYHTKEGFQVSKGDRREAKGNQQGEAEKQGDCAILCDLYACTY
jgi:hypothetical protein